MKSLKLVSIKYKEDLRKYFNEYLEELWQFDRTVKFDEYGKPIYKWFDYYWEDMTRWPYAFFIDNQFAGFALMRETERNHYEISEFYILPEYRKNNNAMDFAMLLFNKYKGKFSFSTRLKNVRAMNFWDKVAAKFPDSYCIVGKDFKGWYISVD